MTVDNQNTLIENAKTERRPNTDPIEQIELGEWYWSKGDEDTEKLWCITKVGSNFAELTRPGTDYTYETRVHVDHWNDQCRANSIRKHSLS